MATQRKRGRAAVEARAAYLRLHPLCAWCQRKGLIVLAQEVDHIVPLYKDGADTDDNKQALCKECHLDKTASDMGHARRVHVGLDGWPVE